MDLLTSQTVDALLLASDDRDFLPLVRRLRTAGMKVHGFGSKAESRDMSRFHSSWTQAKARVIRKVEGQNADIGNPVPVAKTVPAAKPAPAVKAAATTPALQPHPLSTEFSKTVQTRLASGALTLSSLGSWIRQDHPKLTPLLGPGKLKKRLDADSHFKVSGNRVSLVN